MHRREALRNVALLLGGAISVTTMGVISQGCTTAEKSNGALFTPEQENTITELAETIIPATRTPGAKAAGVGAFIAMMVKECYPDNIQKTFLEGLDDLDKRAGSKFSNSFVALTPQQRIIVLGEVVEETKKRKEKEKEKDKEKEKAPTSRPSQAPSSRKDPGFFQLAKELTMLGYFTSEIGAKQALTYVPVPGRYESCVDVKPGQTAWAL
ncbi:MAG: gluconate 2-dehydrogenase subunit 3 family protein [Chitinophagaceae bacterium]